MKPKQLILMAFYIGTLYSVGCAITGPSQPEQSPPDASAPRDQVGIVDLTPQDTTLPERQEPTIPPDKAIVPESPQPDQAAPPLPSPTSGWCARVKAGPGTIKNTLVALSSVHAQVRFFGFHDGYPAIDALLAKGLTSHQANDPTLLLTYAQQLPSVCALSAETGALPQASIKREGEVAIIKPGTGPLTLPQGTKAVVIDLRQLPVAQGLTEAIERAVSLALGTPVARSFQTVIFHEGMKDQYFNAQNVYKSKFMLRQDGFFAAKATEDLPLAFIVGERLPPSAARIAGALRLARRAWLLGRSIPAAVAESHWRSVGQAGLAFRAMWLLHQNQPWPDTIPADKSSDQLNTFLATLPTQTKPPVLEEKPIQRRRPKLDTSFRQVPTRTVSLPHVRAALLIAHGALRLFFPYFKRVGDRIDERLQETWKSAEALTLTGTTARHLLRRFGEAIQDGHCFVYSLTPQDQKYILIELEQLKGEAVITRSKQPGLNRGDTLLSIDGVKIKEWFEKEYKRTSAATPWYRFHLASRELQRANQPVTFEVKGPDGSTRSVQAIPQTANDFQAFYANKVYRKAGFLSDLSAPDIYYLNLDGQAATTLNISTTLQTLQSAKGLILDLRGYPGSNTWSFFYHILDQPAPTPLFLTRTWTGLFESKVMETKSYFRPQQPSYKGPIMFLVGPNSVSAAEHLSTILKHINRATFVGRTTAGTNGNITGLMLPAALVFTFTGMEILFQDRKPFHGVGIVPDIEVEPTPQELSQGVDQTIVEAIKALKKVP